MQTADYDNIYGLLYAGKRVQLSFDCDADAIKFRNNFAKFKARQERNLLDTGFMDKKEVPAFSFLRSDKNSSIWTLAFTPRNTNPTFKILVLDDE